MGVPGGRKSLPPLNFGGELKYLPTGFFRYQNLELCQHDTSGMTKTFVSLQYPAAQEQGWNHEKALVPFGNGCFLFVLSGFHRSLILSKKSLKQIQKGVVTYVGHSHYIS